MRDTNVQHAVHAIVLALVELLKKGLARLNLSRMRRQTDEQIEFGAGQCDRFTVQTDRTGSGVHEQSSKLQSLVVDAGLALAASEQRVDSRHEHSRLHRFDDVVIGAEFQAEYVVDIVVARRQYQDRILVCRTQLPANRESILAGQSKIQDDEIRNIAYYLCHDLIPAIRDGHAEA